MSKFSFKNQKNSLLKASGRNSSSNFNSLEYLSYRNFGNYDDLSQRLQNIKIDTENKEAEYEIEKEKTYAVNNKIDELTIALVNYLKFYNYFIKIIRI